MRPSCCCEESSTEEQGEKKRDGRGCRTGQDRTGQDKGLSAPCGVDEMESSSSSFKFDQDGADQHQDAAWLKTAEQEVALDTGVFGEAEQKLDELIRDYIQLRVAPSSQGVQAAIHLLGESWAAKNLPDVEVAPSFLLPPFISSADRDTLIEQTRQNLIEEVENLPNEMTSQLERSIESRLKQNLRRHLLGKREAYNSMSELKEETRNSVGAALAAIWLQQPHVQEQHMQSLSGMLLPEPLRAHIWRFKLGGPAKYVEIGTTLSKKLDKAGQSLEDVEKNSLRPIIFRTGTEMYSSHQVMSEVGTSGAVNSACSVLLRLHLITGQKAKFERHLLLLGPIFRVFPCKHPEEKDFCWWLACLMEVDKLILHGEALHEQAISMTRKIKSMDEPLAALLAKLYMADKRKGGEGFKDDKQAEEGVALLFEPWLDTGLAGYLGMQPLCWCWDQCFLKGWHILPRLCIGLALRLSVELRRCSTWEACESVVRNGLARVHIHQLQEILKSDS